MKKAMVAGFAVVVAIGCGGATRDREARWAAVQAEYAPKLEIPPLTYKRTDLFVEVHGQVKNGGERSIALLVLNLEFLDKQGKTIHEDTVTVVNSLVGQALKPGMIRTITAEQGQMLASRIPSQWAGEVRTSVQKLRLEPS